MRYVLAIDSAADVVLADVDKGVRMPIGQTLQPGRGRRVTTAAWSPAGEWTAWSVDGGDRSEGSELRLHSEETDEWSVLADAVAAFYLCPSPCGRRLAHLSPGPLGLELGVSDVLSRDLTVIERGQPLFWSWRGDGGQLAVHVGDRAVVVALDGDPVQVLSESAGPFIAPWWLPGGSVVHADGDAVVATGPDGTANVLVASRSTGRFVVDPEGRRLAVVEMTDDGGALVVIDLAAAQRRVVTTDPVAAFFWSPDGNRLAVLAGGEGRQLRWLVDDGFEARPLSPFRPGKTWATAVLPFFEQYAQSHAHWSPDSAMLIAPAVDDRGDPGAVIHDVDGAAETNWLPDAQLAWWA